MRFTLRLLCIAGCAVLLAAAVLGPLKPVADRFLAHGSPEPYDLGAVFRWLCKFFAIGGLVLIWSRIQSRGEPPGRRWGWLLFGFSVGVFSMASLVASQIGTGALRLRALPIGDWPAILAQSLVAGVLVGLTEELVFRGFLLGGAARDTHVAIAVVGSSVLYASCHYFTAYVPVAVGPDPGIGWPVLVAHFRALVDPVHIPSWGGLLMTGATLAAARLLTGTVACPIGIHAGWVFLMKGAKVAVAPSLGVRWLYGANGIVGRPHVALALLAVVGLIALATQKPRALSRVADRSP